MPRKKGFWIKKSGFIAVDISESPKEKADFNKIRKPREKRLITQGKSVKYIKAVIIPELWRKIENQQAYVRFFKRRIHKLEPQANALVREIRRNYAKKLVEEKKKLTIEKRKYKSTIYSQAKVIAEQIYKKQVRSVRSADVSIAAGISSFYVLQSITEKYGLEQICVEVLLIMRHYQMFRADNGADWGITRFRADRGLKLLLKDGYVERFKKGVYVYYTMSVKGQQLYDAYKKEFKAKGVIKEKLKYGETKLR